MTARRVYCWYSGLVFVAAEGEPCPECNQRDHRVHEGDTCGSFVEIDHRGGEPCARAIGHTGEHSTRAH